MKLGAKLRVALAPELLHLYAPLALVARNVFPPYVMAYTDLGNCLKVGWIKEQAIIFVGALGIAARAIAPFIRHKSHDPAIIVMDVAGHFAISLLSGHWGGGNALTRRLADLIGATPVITTASDSSGKSLDLLLKKYDLKIQDWPILPALQGRILENHQVSLYDPYRVLPPSSFLHPTRHYPDTHMVAIHWRKLPQSAECMRVSLPVLHAGIGFRKNLTAKILEEAIIWILNTHDYCASAICCVATINEKACDPAFMEIARKFQWKIRSFPQEELRQLSTPNPSEAVARRFHTEAFSVCESAALASARQDGPATLILPKVKFSHAVTFAIAVEDRYL